MKRLKKKQIEKLNILLFVLLYTASLYYCTDHDANSPFIFLPIIPAIVLFFLLIKDDYKSSRKAYKRRNRFY